MVEWMRATPWRQGHLLSQDAAQAFGLHHREHPEDTVVVVISHHCDLTQSPVTEPLVEVVVGRRIAKEDGNNTHAKTARTLHIPFEGNDSFWAEFVITAKESIPKEALAAFLPLATHSLSPERQTTLQRWLAMRYQRSAFPDEFERRLKQKGIELDKKISKAVKPHGELITAVLFDVDEGADMVREGSDDLYVLDIMLLYAIAPDVDKAKEAANQAVAAIQTAFEAKLLTPNAGQWKGIELRYCEAISENGITYSQFSQMKRWNLDYLSLGAEPQQAVMSE